MKCLSLVTLGVLGVLVASAGAPAKDLRVRHGEGIGRLHLGMTRAQVRRVLGPGALVVHRERRTGGRIYVEDQWDFAWWTVGFLGPPGRLRVVKIASMDRSQRTPERLGIGNTPTELGRELQPLRCTDVYGPSGPPGVTHSECAYTLPSGRQTVFIFDKRGGFRYDPNQHVAVVEVRARGCDYWGRNCGR
jgi:hypothetical protein